MTIGPTPFDPNNQNDDPANYKNDQQITNDVQQYIDDQNQMSADYAAIQTALANLFPAGGHMSPDQIFAALMAFFMQVFPDILSYQEGNMNLLADSQNISSDLRGFVNSIQNDFNTGANATAADMQDMINNTQDLSNWTTFLSSKNSAWTTPPLDPTDAGQINQQLTDIENQFTHQDNSTTSPNPNPIINDWGNAQNMANDMTGWPSSTSGGAIPGWFSNPDTTNPANPAPQIKAIQGSLQQANSSVSTMATTTQTSEQFYTNQYNQLTGIDNSMQQNSASEVSSFVTNQKTS